MEYVYHRVPKNMQGTTLYPLNVLKAQYPELYAEIIKKYEGREDKLTQEIPPLHCLWNDVLHFTAVEPHILKQSFAKAGLELARAQWFKVPISLLQKAKVIALTYRDPVTNLITGDRYYESFDPKLMSYYRVVPEETIESYKERHSSNKPVLLFHAVPHILYKDALETSDLEVVFP